MDKLRKKIIKKEARQHKMKLTLTGLLLIFLIFTKLFVLDIVVVSGRSMEPTLTEGQALLLLKSAYWFAAPQDGDIIVVQHGTERYIKRIVACPGEIPPEEKEALPENQYYIMGDNREVSVDSRSFGAVSEELIIGRIIE